MFGSFDISTSALTAERLRLDTITSNIANIDTTRDPNNAGQPYRRLQVDFKTQLMGDGRTGVTAAVEQDPSDFNIRHEPWNPQADTNGNVLYPNVNLSTETVNSMEASRAYEANATAIETTKSLYAATLRILA
jgi:flagellar basal-body rod protein FlgC